MDPSAESLREQGARPQPRKKPREGRGHSRDHSQAGRSQQLLCRVQWDPRRVGLGVGLSKLLPGRTHSCFSLSAPCHLPLGTLLPGH